MIERKVLKKRPEMSVDAFLTKCDAYAIESIVDDYIRYIAFDNKFAIIRHEDAMLCDIDEMNELAVMFRSDVKQEILDIYEELKDLERRELRYWEV